MKGDIHTESRPEPVARNAPGPEHEGRPLKRKWLMVLAAIGILIWAFFGAFSLLPLWLWITVLAVLIAIEFAIALFGPRSTRSV
ncbi:MAG TPA: hypothetical protein VNN73_13380 [Blastocatellia bacterium]|nr:hypothetical protein [Blastocatellia bacterium]